MFPSTLLALISAATLSSAHTVLTYPGWRGDNLITNDSFPFGMQWMYPCKFAMPNDPHYFALLLRDTGPKPPNPSRPNGQRKPLPPGRHTHTHTHELTYPFS